MARRPSANRRQCAALNRRSGFGLLILSSPAPLLSPPANGRVTPKARSGGSMDAALSVAQPRLPISRARHKCSSGPAVPRKTMNGVGPDGNVGSPGHWRVVRIRSARGLALGGPSHVSMAIGQARRHLIASVPRNPTSLPEKEGTSLFDRSAAQRRGSCGPCGMTGLRPEGAVWRSVTLEGAACGRRLEPCWLSMASMATCAATGFLTQSGYELDEAPAPGSAIAIRFSRPESARPAGLIFRAWRVKPEDSNGDTTELLASQMLTVNSAACQFL